MSRRSSSSKNAKVTLQTEKQNFVKLGKPKDVTRIGVREVEENREDIKPGDCVYIRPPELRARTIEGFHYWKAQVKEIRGDGDDEAFLITWFYTAEEARKKSLLPVLPAQDDLKKVVDHMGRNELLSSDHEQVISSQTAEDIVDVVRFDDRGPFSPENVHPNDYFTRFRLVTKEGRPHFLDVTKHCTCQTVYDPDQDVQRFCLSCVRWFDQACMTKSTAGPLVPFEEGQEETPAEEVKRFLKSPIIRGYSGGRHLYWEIVGTGRLLNQVTALVSGLFDGEVPDWKTGLPEGFVEAMEVLRAMPGYICPSCDRAI
ncbi:hypothetical protein GLOTRDRAFT_97168 [Gloeophyllum trabeum ATCC 11539]|uniref:BAH domain-containing protein n=1 Tax=Gloeophyllum trabeum (strain ATCC 11539 / FP-39264 / Madison 617) TaxID=670483 RepID=S7PS28_GLOTA|nr:uncharacterized protein GLOTRDRAFT_97168 [Gloeophyllum trabeum ATCC 11539]EPQ50203.1 hypothetical protein GLOTRDRAFT_97168 [Gloeophyllum trabeum ATCC 11539]